MTRANTLTPFPPSQLALAMGVASCGSGLGAFCLAPLLSLATESLALHHIFYCLAGLVATIAGFALLYKLPEKKPHDLEEASKDTNANVEATTETEGANLPGEPDLKEAKKDSNANSETNTVKLETDNEIENPVSRSYKSALSCPAILLLLSAHFLFNLGISVTYSFFSDMTVQRGDVSLTESSAILSIIGVTNCVGRIVFGKVLDTFRPHTILLTTLVSLANALAVLSNTFVTSMAGHSVCAAVFGLTFGSYVTSFVPVLKTICHDVTLPLGLVLFTIALSCLAGPSMVGLLYDMMGDYSMGFYMVGGLGVVGSLLFPIIPRFVPQQRQFKDEAGAVKKKEQEDGSEEETNENHGFTAELAGKHETAKEPSRNEADKAELLNKQDEPEKDDHQVDDEIKLDNDNDNEASMRLLNRHASKISSERSI